MDSKAARWLAADAVRELGSKSVQKRLAKQKVHCWSQAEAAGSTHSLDIVSGKPTLESILPQNTQRHQ